MKICLINNLYQPYERGGSSRMTEIAAESFEKMDHQVFIISSKPIFNQKKSLEKSQKIKAYYLWPFNIISYYNLWRLPKFLRFFWHLFDIFNLVSYFKIKKILKEEKPDLIITNNLKGIGFLSPKAIKSLKIKHIHILHDIQLIHPSGLMMCGGENKIKSFLNLIHIKTNKRLFQSPDIIISPSKWLLDEHLKYGFFPKSKKTVLANPIEVSNVDKNSNNKQERFRFIYLGQVEEHKGILFLIKTFKLLEKNSGNKCELIIVGNGSKISAAKKIAAESKKIYFKNWENKNQGLAEIKKSNCLVAPSLCYENSPTAIYEAASTGVPVIASELGGIPELINLLGGFLFKAGSEEDLISQMKWALSNQEKMKKIGDKSRNKIEKLSKNNYFESLLKITSNLNK